MPQCIQKGSGENVLNSETRVITRNNRDVTKEFLKGAEETLNIAKLYNAKYAILKERSPSCGVNLIYNNLKNEETIVKGSGVTTALLKKNNIVILSEEEI
jgi:uncharacterized protein YbbK (DUF523 family)